jgi:hypothetical protein
MLDTWPLNPFNFSITTQRYGKWHLHSFNAGTYSVPSLGGMAEILAIQYRDTGYRSVPRESEGKDDYGKEYDHLPVCPAFKEIGELRGDFDLGLIPIGAYKPRWIMRI